METNSDEMTVVDVYEIAAAIGKEFEKIIDSFGPEAVTDLMPKVITALEQLEFLATKNDRENAHVTELKAIIQSLEIDKIEKAEERMKYEKELELIEENWKIETNDLLQMVSKLKEENRKLNGLLEEKSGCSTPTSPKSFSEQELKMVTHLRETINKQREIIKNNDREILKSHETMNAMQAQLDRLLQVNKDIRRKSKMIQKQARLMLEEKGDLQAHLQENEQELTEFKKRLGIAEKENEDLVNSKADEMPDLRGKLIIDLNDPDRPRFTLAELKKILFERNELKGRVMELEDELAFYKPKNYHLEDDRDDEMSAQGPIMKEPDEKLYPWKKQPKPPSSIKRFFRILLGESTLKEELSSSITGKISFTNAVNPAASIV